MPSIGCRFLQSGNARPRELNVLSFDVASPIMAAIKDCADAFSAAANKRY